MSNRHWRGWMPCLVVAGLGLASSTGERDEREPEPEALRVVDRTQQDREKAFVGHPEAGGDAG